MSTWVMVAHSSRVQTVSCSIYIGTSGSNPVLRSTHSIPPLGVVTPQYAGLRGGPVKIDCDFPVFASQRALYGSSFDEATGTYTSPLQHFVYDDLDRLVAVVDPASDTTRYAYDAAGNVTSVSHQSSSQVSVLQLTPGSGPAGSSVPIHGTAFSALASQNTVQFNGATATVTSASNTQLVATVPVGATTGPVSVTGCQAAQRQAVHRSL